MQIKKLDSQNVLSGSRFKLSEETIKHIENSTRLSYQELKSLSMQDSVALMREKGTLKEPSKLKLLVSNLYRKLGEKIGFIEKKQNIYTHID